MQTHSHWTGLPATARGAVAAMGNFDGVHRGHRAVIDAAKADAATRSAPFGVITFEPHPREYFAPDAPPFRLMNAEARANALQKLGVRQLYELPFDAVLAGLTADDFAREVLAQGLGVAEVVVGADFRFGKGRTGDAALLQRLGQDNGFGVTIQPLIAMDGLDVSSTRIRDALSQGDTREAARMLGHPHRIEGPVQHGDKRGRDLGFPTANLHLDRLHLPRFGVYAALVDILTGPFAGQTHPAAASLGVRPTFGVNAPNLESFLLDFTGDLYGARISVALIDYLRDEIAYTGIAPLIDQMNEDVATTRRILANR